MLSTPTNDRQSNQSSTWITRMNTIGPPSWLTVLRLSCCRNELRRDYSPKPGIKAEKIEVIAVPKPLCLSGKLRGQSLDVGS